MKIRVEILILFSFSLLISLTVVKGDLVCDNAIPPCPTNNSQCVLSGNATVTDQTTSQTDYFNYTAVAPYQHVKITVTQSDIITDYDPSVNWTAGECPVDSGGCTHKSAGKTDTCENDVKAGTYIIGAVSYTHLTLPTKA
mgnify:CR=1 FL=1